MFSLEHRPVPSLYWAAWVLSLAGLGLVVVGFLAGTRTVTAILVLAGCAFLAVGLASGAAYQTVLRRSRPPERYRGPSPVLLFVIVLVVAQLVVAPLLVIGLDVDATTGVVAALLAIFVLYLATVQLFVVASGALKWRDMGWRRLTPGRAVSDAVVALAIMPGTVIVIAIVAAGLAAFFHVQPENPLPLPRSFADTVAFILGPVVIAPVGEEVFFRGFSLTAWQRDVGPRGALIRSSLLFAIAHLLNVRATSAGEGVALVCIALVAYIPLALLLGVIFQQRGLLASILAHATYNGTVVALALLVHPVSP